MADVKVNIYTPSAQHVGYFLNPEIESFPDGDYEISGRFYDDLGEAVGKMEFNPEVLPYVADLSDVKDVAHKKLVRVYLQRGRQPIRMTGTGAN
ncbi:MAG: hypothetical protein JST44_22250 [Cyanobacteria bacterium SZAS LIN-5]|nr:hypothetical protein [Cyanobacteria bacterium SZAS LIN-5]RTL44037.1 MAG: hypothetical protein EKK48_07050 [Candidatus Melainabacteria bacterium]